MTTQLEFFSISPQEKLQEEVCNIKDEVVRLRKRHFATDTENKQLIIELRAELDALKDLLSKGA